MAAVLTSLPSISLLVRLFSSLILTRFVPLAVPDVFFLPLLAPDLVDPVDGLVVGLPVVLEDVGVGDPVDGLVVGLPVVDSDLVVVFDEVCPVEKCLSQISI